MQSMRQVVLINGKKQTRLSVFNRLTQFGDGLFETCVVSKANLLFWSAHFARLEKGCAQLKINPISEQQWLKDIAKALELAKLEHAVVKIFLSRGESVRGYGFSSNIQPIRFVIVSEMPTQMPSKYALSVCCSGYADNQLLSNIKHCNRLEQILARSDLSADECIMLDNNDNVISVTQGNIFAVKSGVLLTPSLDKCGITGTRREAILKIATNLGLQVKVGKLTLQALLDCDEIFISNSVIGIKSVSAVNKRQFTQSTVTQRLARALQKYSLKRKNKYSLKPKKIMKNFLTIVAIFALTWSYWANTLKITEPTVYHLPQGANIISTVNNLEERGVIRSPFFMRIAAKVLGFDTKLKSGYYDIVPNMSALDLLENFVSATVANRNITLIEGKTVRHYYQQLQDIKMLKPSGTFVNIMHLLGIKSPYEGIFWPDTYRVQYGDSVASVFHRSHQTMQRILAAKWKNRDKNTQLKTPFQALILASLIEKETAHNAEKSHIAGVFLRRLKLGMRLQTDPTVVYALGESYRGSLTRQDLKFNSPYNTYRNHGLPPTPISSVSITSLHAALHPASGDTLFFVAKKDGSHAFAKTYQQHRLNIKKYLTSNP
ncbi:FIG004453: protein YceG like [Bathymodiolus brooksi thiotrophic gill symbiont]|nr:FIG004453: protein YceG like [Bathymodiolus brooksi thiotrophic gill symbiont]